MAIRKGQQQRWSLEIHDGKHAGAATCAARTRADIELASYHGKHILLACLDCSKCYESVGHQLAGDKAVGTGLQPRVANVIFDMHNGDRRDKALPEEGNQGLVAGCAFAKGILKAFMTAIKTECPERKLRDCVDDTTLSVEGDTAAECAGRMHTQLEHLKGGLRKDNMALDDGKPPVQGLTKKVRNTWRQYGEMTRVATYL